VGGKEKETRRDKTLNKKKDKIKGERERRRKDFQNRRKQTKRR